MWVGKKCNKPTESGGRRSRLRLWVQEMPRVGGLVDPGRWRRRGGPLWGPRESRSGVLSHIKNLTILPRRAELTFALLILHELWI